MTVICNENAKILTKIGLTALQAEVYLTLARLNKATIKTISASSKIDRANVYRVLTRLGELDLVEKLLSNPTVFKALPINDGVKMLLERKEKENEEIKAQTLELLKKYRNYQELPVEDVCEFILVPEGKLSKRKVDEMVEANQSTHEIIIYWSDFEKQKDDVTARWRQLLLKGIEVKIIVYLNSNRRLPQNVLALKKYQEFKIKKTLKPPKATISIIDGIQAFVSVTPMLVSGGGLWLNNPCIVGLFRDYFLMLWRTSKTL